jgi:hypothetical protein
MYKLLTIISLCFLTQITYAGHHESSHMKKGAVIGYEISDDGEKLDIIAGDPSLVKIWVDYVEAHNQRDLEAIDKTNADDMVGKAPNGVIVNGSAEHAAFLKIGLKHLILHGNLSMLWQMMCLKQMALFIIG